MKNHPNAKPLVCLFLLLAAVLFACNKHDTENPDHPAVVDKILDSARVIFDADNTVEGVRYIDSAYATINNPGPIDLYKKYSFKKQFYFTIASHAENKNQYYGFALLYADSMLAVIKQPVAKADYKKYVEANFSKGDILFETGRYAEAYKYFYAGKVMAEKKLTGCEMSAFTSRLGIISYRQGRFVEAARYFKTSFTEFSGCRLEFDDFLFQQANIDNIGLSYYKAGMADSALIYYNQAIVYINTNCTNFTGRASFCESALGVVYGNQASVYYLHGDIAKAEALMKQSIAINIEGEEKMDAQYTQLKLAELYMAGNRLPEASSLLKQVEASLNEMPNQKARLAWFKLQSDYCVAVNQPTEANRYLKHYALLKDTIELNDHNILAANAGLEFETLEKQYELDIVKKKSELDTLYLFIAIIVSLMTLIIFLQLWRSWRVSKRHIVALTNLNNEVTLKNEQLRHTLIELNESQQANGRMMKIIAHDLRSPVGAIVSFTEWMMAHEEESKADVLPLMHKTALNALSLIGDLLHLKAPAVTMHREPVELETVLEYCVKVSQPQADEKGQQIILQPFSAVITGDQGKLSRVFCNLINNAVKFSPPNSAIHIAMEIKKGNVVISIKDEGMGIPPHLRDKIFDGTAEIKRKGTSGEPSFGLGLAITRQIVQAHYGNVWFDSEPGKGTCFYVSLPFKP